MSVIETRIDIRGPGYRDNLDHNTGQIALARAPVRGGLVARDVHIPRHRARGKLLVRERIDFIVDDWQRLPGTLAAGGWYQYGNEVPGAGNCHWRSDGGRAALHVHCQDATVKGGSFFHETVKKHIVAQEIAQRLRLPCLYLVDCGGAFLPEQDRVFPQRITSATAFTASAACRRPVCRNSGGVRRLHGGRRYIPALSDEW